MTLRLFDHPVSSYAQKVRIALREKGLAFEREVPSGLGSGRAGGAFAQHNPRNEVPALHDGELRIFDSTIILEYLEERFPDPPLLPTEPGERARARMIEDVCDTHYEAINWGLSEVRNFGRAKGALAERLERAAAEQTAIVQRWLEDELGERRWFGGESFGLADVAVAPILNRSAYNGLGPAAGSPLAVWLDRARARASVAETFAEFEAGMPAMKRGAEALASGAIRREYRDHRLEWMIKSGGLDVVADGLRAGNIRFSWPEASEDS